MFIAILALRRVIANNSYKGFLRETYTRPGFVLMYSPYCGSCKQIHPTWHELMDKYESATDIIIGEIDCIENRAACHEMLAVPGWPSFGGFAKGRGNHIEPDRTLEAFVAVAESIRRRNLSLPCLVFPADFDDQSPYFLYRSSGASSEAACTFVRRVASAVPRAAPRLYLVEGSRQTSLTVILTADRILKYRMPFTFPKVRQFVAEWSLFPFSGWSLEEGYRSRRRFFFFVSERREDADPYYVAVLNRTEKVVAAKIPIRYFGDKYHVKIQNLSVIAFDRSKQKFGIFPEDAFLEKFDSFLDRFIDGALDTNMSMDASLLFPSQIAPAMKIAVPATAGAVVLASIVFAVLRKRAQKVE
jgi:thiol-disulfide isomerase/thioredoxin